MESMEDFVKSYCDAAHRLTSFSMAVQQFLSGKICIYHGRHYYVVCGKILPRGEADYCHSHTTDPQPFGQMMAREDVTILTSLDPNDYLIPEIRTDIQMMLDSGLRPRNMNLYLDSNTFSAFKAVMDMPEVKPIAKSTTRTGGRRRRPVGAAAATAAVAEPVVAPVVEPVVIEPVVAEPKPVRKPVVRRRARVQDMKPEQNFITMEDEEVKSSLSVSILAGSDVVRPVSSPCQDLDREVDPVHRISVVDMYDAQIIYTKTSRKLGLIDHENGYHYVVLLDAASTNFHDELNGTIIGTLEEVVSDRAPILHRTKQCYVRPLIPYMYESRAYYPCMITHGLFDETGEYIGSTQMAENKIVHIIPVQSHFRR